MSIIKEMFVVCCKYINNKRCMLCIVNMSIIKEMFVVCCKYVNNKRNVCCIL